MNVRQAKIAEPDVVLPVDEDVLGFDITVDDAYIVERSDGQSLEGNDKLRFGIMSNETQRTI